MNAHPRSGQNQPIEERIAELTDEQMLVVIMRLESRLLGTVWQSSRPDMFDYMFQGRKAYLLGWVRFFECNGIEFPEHLMDGFSLS